MFKIQSSKAPNLKVQCSKFKVQRQSPHIAISAILRDNSCAEVIQGGPRCGAKNIPAVPKDYRETPHVGVDGFEPPTLCL